MKISVKAKRVATLLLIAASVVAGTAACSTTTPEAMCAFAVGDGRDGHDTKVQKVVTPGQNIGSLSDKVARYVPCNPRNFVINDGSVKDINNNPVGDRRNPSTAYTKNGTPVLVSSESFWTLNQNEPALRQFYEVCYKYTCFSEDNKGGSANFSTPGWNGMLAENWAPTIDEIAKQAMAGFDDSIWNDQTKAPALRVQLAQKMSELFNDTMRKRFGNAVDLFCGSGNSSWNDSRTVFTCSSVRITVPVVARSTDAAVATPQSQLTLNADRLAAAKALYGDSAGYWLGVLDSIDRCRQAATPCQILVGSAGATTPIPTK